MKRFALVLTFSLSAMIVRGDDVSALKAIEARYDQKQLKSDEALRQKYVMELSKLRWHLVRHAPSGWEAVDAEIEKHPLPANTDTKTLSKARIGMWYSPRHDYLYRADGTWTMDPADNIPDSTHGTWTIQGNQYTETVATTPETKSTYTIILLDANNFIFTDPETPAPFYERHSPTGGFPLRRDEEVP